RRGSSTATPPPPPYPLSLHDALPIYYRLFLAQQIHFPPDYIGGQRTSTRRIDTKHHRFHLVVSTYFAEFARNSFGADYIIATFSRHDITHGVYHRNAIVYGRIGCFGCWFVL